MPEKLRFLGFFCVYKNFPGNAEFCLFINICFGIKGYLPNGNKYVTVRLMEKKF